METIVGFPVTFEDPVREVLKKSHCDSTIFPSEYSIPVAIEGDDTFGEAVKKLISNQILAAPILEDGLVLNRVISMIDVLKVITDRFTEDELKNLRNQELWETSYATVIRKAADICGRNVLEVLRSYGGLAEPFCILKSNCNLLEVLQRMIIMKSHRALIVDENNLFVNIITLSRIMELLSPTLHIVPEVQKSLEELGLEKVAIKKVVSISQNEMTFKGFKLMKEKSVSGIAILDDNGIVVGSLSVNDLKLIDFDFAFIDLLSYSLKEYLQVVSKPDELVLSSVQKHPIRATALREILKNMDRPVITCSMKHSLKTIISGMNRFKIHRVFVVNETKGLIGVLSCQDILTALIKLKDQPFNSKYLPDGKYVC